MGLLGLLTWDMLPDIFNVLTLGIYAPNSHATGIVYSGGNTVELSEFNVQMLVWCR